MTTRQFDGAKYFGTQKQKFVKDFDVSKKFAEENEKTKTIKTLLMVIFGMGIGFANGLLGAGGGMLAVPILSMVAGLNTRQSHATAILVILPLCLVSGTTYILRGSVDSFVLLFAGAGVFLGGIIGAKLLKYMPENALYFAFCFIMLAVGIEMLF